ncbi:MAG: NAD(+)/NADH kinase [Planctomycetia bacterium]|nr:NAD(+)/NADH kinase [Planctomycetia bacterium]
MTKQEKELCTRKFHKLLLLGNGRHEGVMAGYESLRPALAQRFEIVGSDFSGDADMSDTSADFALVFGGDGSVLRAVRQLGKNQIPILGVNMGRLGFLTAVDAEDLVPLVSRSDFSSLSVREQILLECVIETKPRISGPVRTDPELVVNEVVVQAGPPFKMLEVELSIDNEPVTTYRGDGLIVSTPVGSTAHALSSGGPILRKDLDAVVIAPISPHTISFRPVVDSAERIYEMRVLNQKAYIIVDGNMHRVISPGDRIRIHKSDVSFKMIRVPGRSYYRTLREKLGWGGGLNFLDAAHPEQ